MREPKNLVIMSLVFVIGFTFGILAMRLTPISELQPQTKFPVEEAIDVYETGISKPSPTIKPGLKYEIPVSWKTYDKKFQKVRFGFRYPGTYPIQDGDEDSGTIALVGSVGQYALEIGRLAYFLDGITEYPGGSRREWYIKLFREALSFDMAYKEGDLIFTPVEFANGNSWYEVKAGSLQKQNYLFGCGTRGRTYYGVYNSVAIIVCDHKTMSQENVYRILQTVTVK